MQMLEMDIEGTVIEAGRALQPVEATRRKVVGPQAMGCRVPKGREATVQIQLVRITEKIAIIERIALILMAPIRSEGALLLAMEVKRSRWKIRLDQISTVITGQGTILQSNSRERRNLRKDFTMAVVT